MNNKVYIESFDVFFGEQKKNYTEINFWEKILTDYGLPADEKFLCLGDFYETKENISYLLINAARSVLNKSNIKPNKIQKVVFCTSEFNLSKSESAHLIQEVIEKCSLENAEIVGSTLGGCTEFITNIIRAQKYISSGIYDNILVLTADKVNEFDIRLEKYALFSDSAAGCILSSSVESNTELIDGFLFQKTFNFRHKENIESTFYKEHFELLCSKLDGTVMNKYFCSNLYPFLFKYKETKSGILKEQLFLENIKIMGHCFGADPMINYFDFINKNSLGGVYGLTSDAPPFLKSTLILKYNA